ncbi:hypothetical protein N431DRAFT_468436 [Stipitochalara longipes BDJ]|nr:hypothetical protein N431DRAFT_468436 [Stipitochalara longipes BDJ]
MGQPHSRTSIAPVSVPQSQQPMKPFDLLCCTSALPYTLTHLAHLLPDDTTHYPYRQPLSLGAVLTPFLLLLATNTPPIPPASIPTFNPFIVLIQVRRSKLSAIRNAHNPAEIKQEYSEPRYFGALTPEVEDYRQNMGKEWVKDKIHVEVEKHEAEVCLRVPGSGRERIGDGEIWNMVKGVEKIWCEDCKVWWEFRAWVREM